MNPTTARLMLAISMVVKSAATVCYECNTTSLVPQCGAHLSQATVAFVRSIKSKQGDESLTGT